MTDHYAEAARLLEGSAGTPPSAQVRATLALTDQVARIADAMETEKPDRIGHHMAGHSHIIGDPGPHWDSGSDLDRPPYNPGGWAGREGAQLLDDAGRVWELQAKGWAYWTGTHWSRAWWSDLPDWAGSNFVGVTDKDRERAGLPSVEHPTDECGECQTGNVGFSEHSHNSACDDDPDEALASVLEDRLAFSHSWLKVARAAREHIEAMSDEPRDQEPTMSSRDDALRRAERAERERDEAYAAREHFSGHIDYWVEQADEARHRAANAEDEVERLRAGIEDMKARALDHRQIVTEGPLVGRILVAHWCDKALNPTEGDPRE